MATKATVLCVDDDGAGLECRSFLLKLLGYDVVTARSGLEALEIFAVEAIDLAVVDYAMPDMDGGTLAARLKGIAPHVPVLMISGEDQVPRNAMHWVDQFIRKGESTTKFLAGVRDLLAGTSPFPHVVRARRTKSLTMHSVKEP